MLLIAWITLTELAVIFASSGGANAMPNNLTARRYFPVVLLLVLAAILAMSNGQPASSRISVYAAGASGDIAPLRIISGTRTGLLEPQGVALDAIGNIYVSNLAHNSITVHEPGASGDVPPVRTIRGAGTRLFQPFGVALDATGNLYVSNELGSTGKGLASITVYAPGATGNVAPIRTISGVVSTRIEPGRIVMVGSDITGLSDPHGVALDASGNLYVSNELGSITVYAPGATGNVAPIRTIKGASTGLSGPRGVALDASGNLYVINGNRSITVYAPGAGADVAPLRISGASTGLSSPRFISLRP